jgi:hypothetical protein
MPDEQANQLRNPGKNEKFGFLAEEELPLSTRKQWITRSGEKLARPKLRLVDTFQNACCTSVLSQVNDPISSQRRAHIME